jgi:hypothetical protein
MKKETTKKTKKLTEMVNELEMKLDKFFNEKVWQMPKKAREIIVKVLPYLAVLSLLAIIPMILSLLGLTMLTPFVYMKGMRVGLSYSVSILFTLVCGILAVVIIPGLFKKQMKVWKIMFWMSLINAVGAILKMDLGSLIIGTGLSWYVLFQIKEYYKK